VVQVSPVALIVVFVSRVRVSYEFGIVPDQLTDVELDGRAYMDGISLKNPDGTAYTGEKKVVEFKPHFYEWATATVGQIAIARKQRSTFRNYVAAEAAAPVVVCAAGKGPLDELDFQFAGVVRSNCVRQMDDNVGPTTDEYFTLTIGGPQTILNNSASVIHAGDAIAWTFYSENGTSGLKRATHGAPRRIGIRVADYHDENRIGRALAFAKPGQVMSKLPPARAFANTTELPLIPSRFRLSPSQPFDILVQI
tara:strand:- start:258 stop:1013 length:756 start_codon:yes stop_codon:yes gene_type:complete